MKDKEESSIPSRIALARELSRPLEQSECNAFLRFLYQDVAKKPQKLALRETLRVARYLRTLALVDRSGASSGLDLDQLREKQAAALTLSEVIWIQYLIYGSVEPSTQVETLAYLERHRDTYFASIPYIELVRQLVEEFQIPDDAQDFSDPPRFMSKSMDVVGTGEARVMSDLSERIYVGYYAVLDLEADSAFGMVAQALQHASVYRRTWKKEESSPEWDWTDVREVVKGAQKQLRKQHPDDESFRRYTGYLVSLWTTRFRMHCESYAFLDDLRRQYDSGVSNAGVDSRGVNRQF